MKEARRMQSTFQFETEGVGTDWNHVVLVLGLKALFRVKGYPPNSSDSSKLGA